MKKLLFYLLTVIFVLLTLAGCMGNDDKKTSSISSTNSQNNIISSDEMASKQEMANGSLDEYVVDIKSSRLAKDYEGKDIVIVNYNFANNSDVSTSFTFAIDDKVFQKGVGLNKCYTAADSAKYSSENQTKEIKKGASIDVEVAYYLNDTETPIEVECSELISFNSAKVTKKFNIK